MSHDIQQDDLEAINPFSEEALIWIRYLSGKLGAVYSFPFGDDVMVFKVCHKVFALLASDKGVLRINLKCDPDRAIELRDIFESVIPGYHMNKRHWNTVIMNGELPQGEIESQIDHSYELVVGGLNTQQKELLSSYQKK
ncbi:MmcQ/YjbR family DNA-binding protein [Marinomonas agarivorans]|nr:MmcQ/YjbR family DNA-binding protein [Marinomonas agarivorans]